MKKSVAVAMVAAGLACTALGQGGWFNPGRGEKDPTFAAWFGANQGDLVDFDKRVITNVAEVYFGNGGSFRTGPGNLYVYDMLGNQLIDFYQKVHVMADMTVTNSGINALTTEGLIDISGLLASPTPPVWIAQTNMLASITLTNIMERPQYLATTGAVALAFAGLRDPLPVYVIISGPDSVTFPAGTHFIGGASWQTNRANHFLVWQTGTNLFVNPITTSEEE